MKQREKKIKHKKRTKRPPKKKGTKTHRLEINLCTKRKKKQETEKTAGERVGDGSKDCTQRKAIYCEESPKVTSHTDNKGVWKTFGRARE